MLRFLLWCILFVLCWPLAVLAILLYPIVWLLLLPFRLVGIAVHGALELVAAIIFLPARLLRARWKIPVPSSGYPSSLRLYFGYGYHHADYAG